MWQYNYSVPIRNDELMHYGVKGMKWGVRRDLKKASTYRSYSDDYNPRNYTTKLSSKQRSKLQTKSDRYALKSKVYETRANKKQASHEYTKAFKKGTTLRGAYGKNSHENTRRIVETAKKSVAADKAYKQAKKEYKNHLNGGTNDIDRKILGKAGARNIQRNVDKGMSRGEARKKEIGKQAVASLVVGGGMLAHQYITSTGGYREAGRRVVEGYYKAKGHRNISWS